MRRHRGGLRCPDREDGRHAQDHDHDRPRDQRKGLYELIRNHLGSVGDLFGFLEREEAFVEAERLGTEFADDFRLLYAFPWDLRRPRCARPPYLDLRRTRGRFSYERA